MMCGLFDPTIWWLEQVPPNLRPNDKKVNELEKLRSHAIFHILPVPNDMFANMVLSSRWATRKVQENVYMDAKEKMPNASEKELLEEVFRSRVFPQNPMGLKITEQEINGEMRNIQCLRDLQEYLVQREKEEPHFYRDLFGEGKRITNEVEKILEK